MEGVALKRVGVLGLFFVISRVRVSDPQWHPYTQTWVTCPPPPNGMESKGEEESIK